MRFLNFSFIPVVQESLNEISPIIYGLNKPKTSGEALRILDLQTPAPYHDKPATLYAAKFIQKYLFHIVI